MNETDWDQKSYLVNVEDDKKKVTAAKKQGKQKKRLEEDSDEEWGNRAPKLAKKKQSKDQQRYYSSDRNSKDEDIEEWETHEGQEKNTSDEENDLLEIKNEDILGPDLFYSEEDRKQLMAMPEIEREKILFQRSEERQALLERRELARKLQAVKAEKHKFTHAKVTRVRSKAPDRLTSLKELKARRQQAKDKMANKLAKTKKEREEYDEERQQKEDAYKYDDRSDDDYYDVDDERDEDEDDELVSERYGFKITKSIDDRDHKRKEKEEDNEMVNMSRI
jgi:RNA polymerase-associated protein RTF1